MPASRPDATSTVPALAPRLAFTLAVLLASGGYAYAIARANPEFVSDFDQVWAAARALLAGRDPYREIGPHAPFRWSWPLYYPLPALLLTSPLAYLPVEWARTIFSGVTAALLAWGITRDGWSRWPVFISVCFMVNAELSQWAALFAAAYFLPPLGFIASAKPNFAVPLGAGTRDARTLVWLAAGAIVLVAASFVVYPPWFGEWIAQLRAAQHFRAPIARPFGFVLVLALLRWRRPEARYFLALSCVPAAPTFYDQVMLFVVCTTFRESLAMAVSTVVLFFVVGAQVPQPNYLAWGEVVGNSTLYCCYLPALVILLRKPNEGALPVWIEARLPRALARLAPASPPIA